jgi:surface antigen
LPLFIASLASSAVVARGYPYASRCPGAGIAERVDRWKMYECNCTSYVAWALGANGQRTDWFVPGSMDAGNWPHVAAAAGIPMGHAPRVGAVAVWPHLSKFGHVAYVTAVRDGLFDVAEYNLPIAGDEESFAFDVRTELSPRGVTFIYVPRKTRTLADVWPLRLPPIR